MSATESDANEGRFLARALWVGGPLLAAVTFAGQAWVWQGTTAHYHDGAWACDIVDAVVAHGGDRGVPPGGRGMLLSAALQVTFLLTLLGLGVASVWTLTRVFLPRWRVVLMGSVGFGLALFLLSFVSAPGVAVPAGGGCRIVASDLYFNLEPYRFAVIEVVYPDSVVDLHRSLSVVVWSLLLPVNVLAWVAVLAVPVTRGDHGPQLGLVERFSLLRQLLFWSSAVQTLINLNHLGALGWVVEIATSVGGDGVVRDLQAGVTLYFGITNSLLLVLLYVPVGMVLSHDACALAREQHPDHTSAVRTQWRTEHDLVVLKQGPLLQLLVFVAPFVFGALASALQSALVGPGS